MKVECMICADSKFKHEMISCSICNYECCKSCMKNYIESVSTDKIYCMNEKCKILFTRNTLVKLLGITYVTKIFQKIINKVRVDKQTALLSTFQETAILEKKLVAEKQELIKIQELLKLQKNKIAEIEDYLYYNKLKKEEKKYIRPCADGNCKGFLNTNYKCELCEKNTCKDCLDIIVDETHVCHPDAKATAEIIKKDTKYCPSCGTGIYKIDGCDQMFCTTCNTAFSWKTGIIEKGRIHNPHYYEFLRRNGNGDIPREEELIEQVNCERITDTIVRSCNRIYKDSLVLSKRTIASYIMEYCRYHFHIYELNGRLIRYIETYDNNIRRNNIDYLKNIIDKEHYEKSIIYYEKKKEIYNEKSLLLNTLINTVNDVILGYYRKYLISNKHKDDIKVLTDEIWKVDKNLSDFIKYCIEEDSNIIKLYNSTNKLHITNYPTFKE